MKKYIIQILFVLALSGTTARSQQVNRFFPEKDLVTTGIYYYPEHWSESQWERDIANISRMGYEFVHLAEFAWFKMEPQEGKFDFAWLDRVVGLCSKYKLKVLLCTPSATTPAWMREKYPETFEPTLGNEVVYIGKNKITDIAKPGNNQPETTIGKLLLSPTRTYAPLMKVLLENYFDKIDGVIHCSGGGQTKCMKYLPQPLRIIKDNLFPAPYIFKLIQQNSGADDREMYQVFNMGHRLEIFTDADSAQKMIEVAVQLNIDAQVVGRVEASEKKELYLQVNNQEIIYG